MAPSDETGVVANPPFLAKPINRTGTVGMVQDRRV